MSKMYIRPNVVITRHRCKGRRGVKKQVCSKITPRFYIYWLNHIDKGTQINLISEMIANVHTIKKAFAVSGLCKIKHLARFTRLLWVRNNGKFM